MARFGIPADASDLRFKRDLGCQQQPSPSTGEISNCSPWRLRREASRRGTRIALLSRPDEEPRLDFDGDVERHHRDADGGARFDWEPFDTFCVPGGEWVEHVNETPSGDAIFFVSSDEPVLKTLHFYSRHGRDESGETVLLETSRRF